MLSLLKVQVYENKAFIKIVILDHLVSVVVWFVWAFNRHSNVLCLFGR